MARSIGQRARARAGRWAEAARLRLSLRQLSGPRQLDAAPGDVTVVCLVRDGAYYLDAFLAHYRGLGARHFVFIDNGSTDGTPERLAGQRDCVVLQSHLPWRRYENHFRSYAARRFCAGHWCLFADMDEIFDFEGSARIGLAGLTRYLAAQGHSALVAQMLEMFPDAPLRDCDGLSYAEVLTRFDHCDTGAITRVPYHGGDPIDFAWWLQFNRLADPGLEFFFGGVRRRIFGEMCCLTKHPLVFVGPGVLPGVHPHCSAHVTCADFTALIRHYKFANDAAGRDARSVAEAAIGHGEDRKRLAVFRRGEAVTLWSDAARRYGGIAPLQQAGFLRRSPRFARFLEDWPDAG